MLPQNKRKQFSDCRHARSDRGALLLIYLLGQVGRLIEDVQESSLELAILLLQALNVLEDVQGSNAVRRLLKLTVQTCAHPRTSGPCSGARPVSADTA